MESIIYTPLKIGLKKPFKILQITDTTVEGANFRSYVTPGLFAGICRLIELS